MTEPIDIRSVLEETIEKETIGIFHRRKMTNKQLAELDKKKQRDEILRKTVLRLAISQYLNQLIIERIDEWKVLILMNAKHKILSQKIGSVPLSYNPWFDIGIPWNTNISTLDKICDEILPGLEQQVYTLISPDVELVWIREDNGIDSSIDIYLEIKREAYKEVIEKVKSRHTED